MYKSIIATFFVLLAPALSYADEVAKPDMLSSLQEDMQEYSEIATRTRQNVDYMPYVISAWSSDELKRLGVSTLGEALTLVPGLDIAIGTVGTPIPIFRGSNPFAIGQSKLVLDGVVVNDKMTGGYNQMMDLPIGIIQRIEVVRGPGSLLSHVNGYAGSIHVITKSNRDDGLATNNELFAELGSSQYKTAGFVASHKGEALTLSGDLFYKTHEQSLPVTIDRYMNSGEAQERLDYYSMGIKADYNKFTFKGRLLSRESGASYGQSFSLSEDETDYTAVDSNNAEMSYVADVADDVKVNLSLGYIELNRRLQNKVVPDGGTVGPPPTVLPDGRYFLVDLVEKTLYEHIELNINAIDMHHINLGIYAAQTDMVKREGQTSDDGMQTFTTVNLLKDTPRDLVSIYIDDLIDLTEKTSVQLGVKYDHYSDVDNQHSPRLALVHRYDDENIFKFMYTSSYREPAWREQYLTQASFFKSTIDIMPEQVDAYEVAYIKKVGLEGHLEINAYYLQNKDQIHAQNLTNTFVNSGDNDLYGAEIEYKYVFQDNDQLYLNYSNVAGENVGDKLAGSARNLGKFYYIYKASDALSLSVVGRYVSSKDRIKEDTRNKVDCYSLFDFSINYNVKQADLDINISVKNAADKKYYLPSPTYPASPTTLNATYPDDFEREGRSLLLGLRKGF